MLGDTGLVDEIAARAAAIDPAVGVGAVYEECRAEDLRLLHARRLWRWYADKLDQRAESADGVMVQTLRAADQVVWSCWKTAFTALAEPLPAAPIPYLAPQFSASATPRTDPPEGLRPGLDDLLRKHVEQLPVAALALPPVCCRRPWWVILSAHEAGHHVQFESSGLEELAQDQVVAAAYAVTADIELAEAWRPWCRELFADAFSVLLAGRPRSGPSASSRRALRRGCGRARRAATRRRLSGWRCCGRWRSRPTFRRAISTNPRRRTMTACISC